MIREFTIATTLLMSVVANNSIGDTYMSDLNDSRAVWNALINAGYSEESTAGVMGNLQAESALRANNAQDSYGYKTEEQDIEYTNDVNDGTISEYSFCHDGVGYGLAQWTYSTRKQKLYDYTVAQGYSVASVSRQIALLLDELASYGYNTQHTSIREASDWVLHEFENPAVQDTATEEYRYKLSLRWYEEYTGTTPDPDPDPLKPAKKARTSFIIKAKTWGAI